MSLYLKAAADKKLPGIQLDACWNLWNLNMGKGGEIEDK